MASWTCILDLTPAGSAAEENGYPPSPLSSIPAQLSYPHLNSTAHIIKRIQDKQEQFSKNPASIFPNPYPLAPEELRKLEDAVRQKPLKVSTT